MDRAYEGDKTRELCQSFGHKPVVPPKKNRINPWEYDHELYKRRNIIERLFRWLKAFRRVCTRYDKLDVIFLSFVQIAYIFTWLKQCQQALKGVIDIAHFNDEAKIGKGQEMVDKPTKLIAIFQRPELDFSNNKADGDDIIGDAYEYLMRNFATESGKSKGQFYTPA